MNKNIHHEFAYQSRELGVQIEDTLGEPPDRKNYARVIASLLGEYAKGTEIDDVNLLSFALADHLRFDDPAGLLAQCKFYDGAMPQKRSPWWHVRMAKQPGHWPKSLLPIRNWHARRSSPHSCSRTPSAGPPKTTPSMR